MKNNKEDAKKMLNEKKPIIVAVDGPAGSGKSSVCAAVCKELGWVYVNTGIIYRALGHLARTKNVPFHEYDLVPLIHDFVDGLKWDPEKARLSYRGEDLTPHLITVTAGNDASLIAKLPLVREKLLPVQRTLCLQAQKGAIVDGRDIGSVVFPDAHLKIYMTASLETRAQRRLAQLLSKAPEKTFEFEIIKAEIAGRDEQDAKRGTAPLMVAEGAIIFDTSLMDEKMAVAKLLELLKDRGLTSK